MEKANPKPAETAENHKLTDVKAGEDVNAYETLYRRLFESAREGILILDAQTRKITDANPFMVDLLGYSVDEFIGKELWEIGLLADKHASQAAFRELQEKRYIRYENMPLESKDGVRCEVDFESRLYDDDRPPFIQCSVVDITLRKQIEAETLRLAAIVESSDDAIISETLEGIIISWNPAAERLFGYPADEAIGKPTTIIFPPDRVAEEANTLARIARGKTVRRVETERLRKDGTRVSVSVTVVPVTDIDGKIFAATKIDHDITERKRIEGDFASSEARMRHSLHAAGLGTFDWDIPNDHLDWSRRHEELWGYATGEFNGTYKAFYDRVHPDDLPEVDFKIQQHIPTHDFSHEFRVVWPDNSVHWIAANGKFLFDETGKPLTMSGAVMDITDRKWAEAELIESREHLAHAQKVAKLGSWETDLTTNALKWSGETYEIFEVGVDDFQGTYEHFVELVHPDDRAAVDKALIASVEQRSGCSIKHRILMPDGRLKYIEEQWEILCDENDLPVRAVGTCQDITRNTLAEAAQRASEARLRAIFEAEPECVKLVGRDCRVLDMNPAGLAMIGADSLEQILGMSVLGLMVPEHREAFAELNKKVFAGESGTLQFEIVSLKGKRIWLDTHATPLLNDDGEVEAHLGVTRDITEKRKAEEKLRESESMLSSTQKIAHIGSWVIELSDSGAVGPAKEYWSDEHYRIYGIEPGEVEVTDELFYNSLHPDDRESVSNIIRDSIEHRKPFDIEHRIILPDGRERTVQAMSEVVVDPKTERPVKLLGSVQDITERKRAEAELIKSREQMMRAQEMAKLGSWELDLATRTVTCSEETYRIIEADVNSFEATQQAFVRLIHPDDREAIDNAFVDSFAKHSRSSIKHRLMMPDGRIKFVEEQWEIVRDANDLPVKALGTCQDVTRNTLADAAMRASEERLSLLFEQMKDGFYYSTADGRLLDVNPAMVEMFGYSSREEMLKVDVTRDLYFSAEDRKSRTLADGKSESDIYRMRRKDGSEIWVEDSGQYKYNTAGNIEFHQGLLRNITERKLAEEALIKAGKDLQVALRGYERVLDNSLDVICSVDEEGRFISVSKASREVWGYKPEELSGRRYLDLVHSDDLASTVQVAADIMAGNPAMSFENRYLHKSGKVVHMMWSSKWVESDKTMFAVARDITERKLIQDQLIESESHKGAIVESALDCIIAMNSDGLVTEFNPAAQKVFGYSRGEAVGKRLADLIIPPSLRDQHRRGMEHYKATGEGPVIGKRFEIAAMRSDGSEFPVELAINAVKLSDSTVFTAFLRDISERKLVENILKSSEQRYRDLVENAHDIIYSLDLKGNFTSLNQAGERITGYSPAEVKEMNFTEIVAPEHLEKAKEVMAEKLNGGGGTAYEIDIIARDGRQITVEVNSKLALLGGVPAGIQGIARDVTERRSLEDQLRQSQKMEAVGQMAGGIAHDFNNMLTAINGYSELTLRQMKEDDPFRHYVQEIKNAGDRSAALTNQLLAFSRRQILQPEVVYVNEIITQTSAMLERVIGEDVELVTVLDPKIGKVKADPGQLTQIIMNLAVNARDAMPDGGKLTFETSNVFLEQEYSRQHVSVLPGAYVSMVVSDNGTGMDAETQQHIFEPFYTTKKAGEGTGLGLATVYGIVKQSNGHILVYSELGMGTTFKIYLPRVVDPLAETELAGASDDLPRGTETILLVEDEEMVRKFTRDTLGMCGYTVIEAGNGSEALAIFESDPGRVDLVMTDVVMPGMGGRELAEKILLRWPDTPVLFSSGYTDDAVVRHGVVNSDANFIQKPFATDSLARKVRDIFEGAGKL